MVAATINIGLVVKCLVTLSGVLIAITALVSMIDLEAPKITLTNTIDNINAGYFVFFSDIFLMIVGIAISVTPWINVIARFFFAYGSLGLGIFIVIIGIMIIGIAGLMGFIVGLFVLLFGLVYLILALTSRLGAASTPAAHSEQQYASVPQNSNV